MSIAIEPAHDFIPAPLRRIAPYGILALIIFAVYGNIYDNTFLFDDDLLITINSYIRDWQHIGDIWAGSTTGGAHIVGGFYRPLQIFLYLLMYQWGDGSSVPFHLLNLTLHIANACLMYRLGTKLKFNAWGVFLATMVWSVHPLHVEAITYMSATADPLFAFFALAAITWLVPDITPRKIFVVIPVFLLGLVSKETMAMFPLLVMVCIYFTNTDRLNWRVYSRTWPLWIISIAYAYWRMHADGLDGPRTYAHLYALPSFATLKLYADHPIYRIYTFLVSIAAYLSLMFYPHDLHMERAFSIYTDLRLKPVLIGLGIIILAGAQVIYATIKPCCGLALSWGILWFMAAHAPDSGILVPMNSLFLEHWMYLPSVGLFLGVAETVAQLVQHRHKSLAVIASVTTFAFAGMLASKTYAQNQVWHDPVSFYTNIFDHGEKSARSRNNLALYYGSHGDYTNALTQFNQAVEISDTYAETRYNMALIYLSLPDKAGHRQDAIDNLHRALVIDPKFYRAWEALASVYAAEGDTKDAEDCHARAVAITEQP